MSVLAFDGGYVLASVGNAFISIWKEPSTMERLAAVQTAEQQVVDGAPSGIVVLTVLMDSAFAVRPAEREEASRIAKLFAPTTRAHAYAIEGSGFRTAAMRAVIAGINALTRTGHPTRVFDQAATAIRWLAPQGAALSEAMLTAALAEARARLS